MALADEIINWSNAVELFQRGMIEESIQKFCNIKMNSKIAFNIGYCYWSLLNITQAHQKFREAIEMDKKLAVAYAMLGQISFYEKNYWEAFCEYEFAFQNLRGNRHVDYKTLGLDYQLYASEVLVNMGIISYFLQRDGELYFTKSVKFALEKRVPEFNKIQSESKAFRCKQFFTISGMKLFQPSQGNVENARKKNFLGNAKVITVRNEFLNSFAALKESTEQPDEIKQQRHRQPPKRPEPPKLSVSKSNPERTPILSTKQSLNTITPHNDGNKTRISPVIPKRPAVLVKTNQPSTPFISNTRSSESFDNQQLKKSPHVMPKPAGLSKTDDVNSSKISMEKTPKIKPRLRVDRPCSHSFPTRRLSDSDELKSRILSSAGRSVPRPPKPRKPLPVFPPPDHNS